MNDMTAEKLQETFQISREAWRRIATGADMIEPMDPQYNSGVTKWSGAGFARWLAAHHPDLAHHTPHLLRPAGPVTPRYHGGLYAAREPGGFRHEHFAGQWSTGYGRLAIAYPGEGTFGPEAALDHLPDATTVIVVQHAWNLYGLPELEAVDRQRPGLVYEPRWSEVAAHIGGPIPWWPSALRRREHLLGWSPSREPEAVEIVTWPSWEPLYDMALREAKGTPVRVACFSIGHEIRSQAVEFADFDIAHMNGSDEPEMPSGYRARQAAERACMKIPAFPIRDDPGEPEVGPAKVIREGVAQMWQRTDDLTVECLIRVSMWTTRYRPFGEPFAVIPNDTTAAGREWVRRAQRTEPTAAHWAWGTDRDDVTGTFVDPVTGSPVVTERGRYMRQPFDEVSYHSYAPHHLPAGSVIREVILDDPVWVRTHDGTLYPFPTMGESGVSFGYSGTGPRTLARLIGRLLDDGSAHSLAEDEDGDDESNLLRFLQMKHLSGTRLPRRLLEEIRAKGPDGLSLLDRLRYTRPRGD
ncbi:hypothetical protein [Frankia tisae]|uniref:hypothetical protein n=1 Tax=Frankia tisae TaxID=2950104 RepID=UPI0021C1ED97|nr:hypothetical protein [Frankia tisae]